MPDDFLGYGIPDLDLARTNALSIDESQVEAFQFYPNPVNSVLNIEIPLNVDNVDVSIYNQLGQEVLTQSITENSNTINVLDLASGIYVMKLSSQNISSTIKFIRSSN